MNLKNELEQIKAKVDPVIDDFLGCGVIERDQEIMLYACQTGGKRLRPALVVLSGELLGAHEQEMLLPAAAVEVLHNATLITDDIIDHSDFRRDKPTCWRKFGRSMAECAVLDYSATLFEILAEHPEVTRLTRLYAETLKVIVDGEISDILFERSGRNDEPFVVANRPREISVDDYIDMIGKKTAVLLKTCCQAGAICAGAKPDQIETIGSFGFKLGLAFQIRDDLLDIFGDEKEFGKKIGKDIIEKKMGNIVILTAFDELDQTQARIITDVFESTEAVSDDDVAKITDIINSTSARQIVEKMADELIDQSMRLFDKLPQNKYASTLKELAHYIARRDK